METPDRKPETVLQTARIIWLALLSTPVLMLIVVWIVAASGRETPTSSGLTSNPIFLILCMIAVVDFALAQNLHRFAPSSGGTQSSVQPYDETGDLRRGFSLFLVRLALFEAIALIGFVAALLGGNPVLYLPFLLLSLAGLLLSSPSEALLRNLAHPKR